MEIVIKLNEKDIIEHPVILDSLRQMAPQIEAIPTRREKEAAEENQAEAEMTSEEEKAVPVRDTAPVDDAVPVDAVDAQPSLEEVRAVLAQVGKKSGTAKAKELLSQFGAAKLTDLSPNHYAAVLQAAKEVQ